MTNRSPSEQEPSQWDRDVDAVFAVVHDRKLASRIVNCLHRAYSWNPGYDALTLALMASDDDLLAVTNFGRSCLVGWRRYVAVVNGAWHEPDFMVEYDEWLDGAEASP